jgi:hypothetical protein
MLSNAYVPPVHVRLVIRATARLTNVKSPHVKSKTMPSKELIMICAVLADATSIFPAQVTYTLKAQAS